jgi:hypothetical protein
MHGSRAPTKLSNIGVYAIEASVLKASPLSQAAKDSGWQRTVWHCQHVRDQLPGLAVAEVICGIRRRHGCADLEGRGMGVGSPLANSCVHQVTVNLLHPNRVAEVACRESAARCALVVEAPFPPTLKHCKVQSGKGRGTKIIVIGMFAACAVFVLGHEAKDMVMIMIMFRVHLIKGIPVKPVASCLLGQIEERVGSLIITRAGGKVARAISRMVAEGNSRQKHDVEQGQHVALQRVARISLTRVKLLHLGLVVVVHLHRAAGHLLIFLLDLLGRSSDLRLRVEAT